MQRFQEKHKENKLPRLPSTWSRYLNGAGEQLITVLKNIFTWVLKMKKIK